MDYMPTIEGAVNPGKPIRNYKFGRIEARLSRLTLDDLLLQPFYVPFAQVEVLGVWMVED